MGLFRSKKAPPEPALYAIVTLPEFDLVHIGRLKNAGEAGVVTFIESPRWTAPENVTVLLEDGVEWNMVILDPLHLGINGRIMDLPAAPIEMRAGDTLTFDIRVAIHSWGAEDWEKEVRDG